MEGTVNKAAIPIKIAKITINIVINRERLNTLELPP